MFGCFVALLTTSLDDGRAAEVSPAIAKESPAALAAPNLTAAPSAAPVDSPAEAEPPVAAERPAASEPTVDSACDFTAISNRTAEPEAEPQAEAEEAARAAASPPAERDLPHSGKKVMKPRQRVQLATPQLPRR
jgi:hypothetical protein